MMTVLIWLLGILLIIVLAAVIWLVSAYNGFVKLRNKTQEAYSAMDVSLKKRYDLIPNCVETVRAYAAHESRTLEEVIRVRNQAMSAADPSIRLKEESLLGSRLSGMLALAESYPELKSSQSFAELQRQLQRVEEIASSRRYYNGVVNKYNTKTEMFPGNLLAGMFGFERKPLYEVTKEEERESQRISL